MAFEFKNSRGTTYYLHARKVKLRGSGKDQTIYFFARDERSGQLEEVPEGFSVMEIQRTGMPVLKKK